MKQQDNNLNCFNNNSVLFARFSNCTTVSFLRILLTSGEREQREDEREERRNTKVRGRIDRPEVEKD